MRTIALVTAVTLALAGAAIMVLPSTVRLAAQPATPILKPLPGSMPAPTVPPSTAAPPTRLCGTELATPAPTGRSLTVGAGGDLQQALDAAQPGDEIVLAAGASYAGSFHLPAKSGAGKIVVRSSASEQLPVGARVGPEAAPRLARVVGAGPTATIVADAGAHDWHLVGLEIGSTPGMASFAAVALGSGLETDATRLPHDIVLDRSWVHGDANWGVKVGVALDAASVTVANSSITDVKSVAEESQAVRSTNGTGPFTLLNDRFEAAGENVMFGGADPAIANLVPSDIAIHYCDFAKPLAWKVGDPSYAGTHWLVKNLFELKNARRVTVDGNTFEQSWADAQAGDAAVLTVRDQNGGAPWSTVESVVYTNNIVRHVGGGVSILGHDDTHPSQPAHGFTVENNLFYDVGGATWGGSGRFILIDSGTTDPGPSDVRVSHNTAWQSGDPVVSGTPGPVVTHPGFVFTDNLVLNGAGGIWGAGAPQGDPTLSTYYPGATVSGNVLVGAPASAYAQHPDNRFPPSVQLADEAGGDYRLAPSSPLHGTAGDGTDPGVDYMPLDEAAACRR